MQSQHSQGSTMNAVKDIYELCHQFSPFDTQESWDKSGLNLGSLNDTFDDILVCLELTLSIAHSLKPHTLIITHHPLFFRPIDSFYTDSYPSNLAAILLRKHCSLIALHTNFDKSHLNTHLVHNILGWKHFKAQDFFMYGYIESTPLDTLAHYVCAALKAQNVRYTKGDDIHSAQSQNMQDMAYNAKMPLISNVYVACGAGCSLLSAIPASYDVCFITGDIRHHDSMMAKSMGISLIDMGHYESEKYFVEICAFILQNAGYNVIIADCKNPFCFISSNNPTSHIQRTNDE